MRMWLALVVTGVLIAIGRIVIISHYRFSGEKLVPEFIVVTGFWLQFILIGAGFALKQVTARRRSGAG